MVNQRVVWCVSLLFTGCAGFTTIERGEWLHVWVDPADRKAETVITRDKGDEEAAAGTKRLWEAPPGSAPARLSDADSIGLTLGEVLEFRVDESTAVELSLKGNAAIVYWNPMKKIDGWKDGNDVTSRESRLLIEGRSPGMATLKVATPSSSREVVITVTKGAG